MQEFKCIHSLRSFWCSFPLTGLLKDLSALDVTGTPVGSPGGLLISRITLTHPTHIQIKGFLSGDPSLTFQTSVMSLNSLHGTLQPWAVTRVSLISFSLHCSNHHIKNSWNKASFPFFLPPGSLCSPSASSPYLPLLCICLSLPLLFNWAHKIALNLE